MVERVAVATPQCMPKNAALPPDICAFGDSAAIGPSRRTDPSWLKVERVVLNALAK